MRVAEPHRWDVTTEEARRIQRDLRPRLSLDDVIAPDDLRLVAGVDNSYLRDGGRQLASAVVAVFAYPSLELVETAFAERPVAFPYVPGLLTFREAPAVVAALRDTRAEPDLVLFDGQGYAHPRRFGLASHLGLLLDRPAVGCAKSRLVGAWEEPARTFGAHTPLVDRDEVVGAAVRTRPRHAPLFVSPGHKVSVAGAVALALACCRGGFLPVPAAAAHDLVTERRKAHAADRSPI